MVISQHCPSALIALTSLALPVKGAFFPRQYHQHFNPNKVRLKIWHSLQDYSSSSYPTSIVNFSGSLHYVCTMMTSELSGQICIVHCQVELTTSKQDAHSMFVKSSDMFDKLGIVNSNWSDQVLGGGTDAHYLFGFTPDLLNNSAAPRPVATFTRSIEHFLCGTEGGYHDKLIYTSDVPNKDICLSPIK